MLLAGVLEFRSILIMPIPEWPRMMIMPMLEIRNCELCTMPLDWPKLSPASNRSDLLTSGSFSRFYRAGQISRDLKGILFGKDNPDNKKRSSFRLSWLAYCNLEEFLSKKSKQILLLGIPLVEMLNY